MLYFLRSKAILVTVCYRSSFFLFTLINFLCFVFRNFLESEWCIMEFQIAHFLSIQDKINRIIMIKLGDLPKNINPAIKVHLDSTTYLTWGEPNFWKKLLYVLPSREDQDNVFQEI